MFPVQQPRLERLRLLFCADNLNNCQLSIVNYPFKKGMSPAGLKRQSGERDESPK